MWFPLSLKFIQNCSFIHYGNRSTISNTFLSLSLIKCWKSGVGLIKCLSEWQTGKTLIRLLLQKQSDLGMSCLSKLFWQATSVRNFRTFTVHKLHFDHVHISEYKHFNVQVVVWHDHNTINVFTYKVTRGDHFAGYVFSRINRGGINN